MASQRIIMSVKLVGGFVLAAVVAAFFGCGGRPFDVKTRPAVPLVISGARAESDGIIIQAEAITDEDFLNDTFDGNLILAGILPVRAMIKNDGPQPIILKKARFEIRPSAGKNFKLAD